MKHLHRANIGRSLSYCSYQSASFMHSNSGGTRLSNAVHLQSREKPHRIDRCGMLDVQSQIAIYFLRKGLGNDFHTSFSVCGLDVRRDDSGST